MFPQVSLYFLIDTLATDPLARTLRDAQRRTWLKDVTAMGHEYGFFFLDSPKRSSDLVDCDRCFGFNFTSPVRHEREWHLLTEAFKVVVSRNVDYIVKADHDVFVCVDHLTHDLYSRPRSQFFMGYFWQGTRSFCRADQNFHVYSRDVLVDVVTELPEDPYFASQGGTDAMNWAFVWGTRAQVLWQTGNLTVFHDSHRLDSQVGWHLTHEIHQLKTTLEDLDFCHKFISLHVFPDKNPKVFDLLFHNNARHLRDRRGKKKYDVPPITPPACFAAHPLCNVSDDRVRTLASKLSINPDHRPGPCVPVLPPPE